MKLTLVYFDVPFWRAEVARLSLYIGKIDYEDRRITFDEFQRVKANGKLDDDTLIPFHQFPCLIVDGVSIAQTGAIARFCGKLSGLYPQNDDLLAAQIDQFIDLATDINVLVASTNKIQDKQGREQKRSEIFEQEISRKLSILDKNILEEGNWILGKEVGLTIADIAIWRLVGWLSSGMLDGIPTSFLKSYQNILNVCLSVDNHQMVVDWMSRTYPEGYSRGNFLVD